MATDRTCEDAMHTSLPGSPPLSSNVGSPNGSGHDLDGMGHRSIDAQFKELRDILLPLARGFADFDNHVKTLSEAVGMVTSRIASVEQTVNALSAKMAMFAEMELNFIHLTARMCQVETHAASASNVSGSARSWHSVAQDHLMTTETHDEDLILSPAPKMNNHEVPFYFDSLANNTSKGLPSGSIPFGKNPICSLATNLSEFIAKQVPCQSGLFLKHEAIAKTLLLEKRLMVFLMQLIIPFAAPIQLSQCVNPDQLKTERSENNLRLCGENWLTNLKFSFLMEMTKVFSFSQRWMLVHKSSASKIAETELENWFSNLLRLVADKRLLLLHLICLFLVFRLKCCNGFSLKLTGLMCDGRPPRLTAYFAA